MRYRLLSLLALACCLAAPWRASAMQIAVTDNDLLGQADLVFVGSVQSDERLPGVTDWHAGKGVIKIERLLKGPKLDTVTVRHTVPPILPPGMIMMDHGGFMLSATQQQLFFLQRGPEGYSIFLGMQSMRPIGEADRFAQLIAAFPYEVVMASPVGPFYFGQATTVSVKITNKGTEPIQCYPATLDGRFFSPRMGGSAQFSAPPAPRQPGTPGGLIRLDGGGQNDAITVEAGKDTTMTVKQICQQPASWSLFPADSYLQSPLMLRARVFMVVGDPNDKQKRSAPGFTVISAPVTALIGFPLPAGDEDKTVAPPVGKPMAVAPVAQPVGKPIVLDQTVAMPIALPAVNNVARPADKPVVKAADKPADKPAEKPGPKPVSAW